MNLKFIFFACLAAAIFTENNYALKCYNKKNKMEQCFGKQPMCLTMKCGKHIVAKCCIKDLDHLCSYNKTLCKQECAKPIGLNFEDPKRPKPPCPDLDSCSYDGCNK
uniref:Uncharacterized protein n=1 Tax=Meloidogyne enterolobii TaxID=390850 RepID=A0A6V7X3A3_MELEN|nr:unnamed protein product [Meloidogyne enterolobii]